MKARQITTKASNGMHVAPGLDGILFREGIKSQNDAQLPYFNIDILWILNSCNPGIGQIGAPVIISSELGGGEKGFWKDLYT